jgi:carbon-monoxide dehydrogenase large subunit
VSRIRGVFHGSTTLVKEGVGTYSSRATVMGGSAVVKAAALLTQSLRQAAATHFSCSAEEVSLVDGLYARVPPSSGPGSAPRSITLAELAQQAMAAGQPLSAEASFESRKRTYSYGAHAAHVAIDPDTGETAVLDYVAVEDVGRIINPLTLHGQTEGAVVQGLGGVFLEQVVYDDYGQPLTGSLTDYAMPRADHFPVLHAVCLELKPSPNNPLGAKGAGEGGVIPTGGVIANAISAALAPLGVSVRDLPLGAHALWRLIREARQENP